MCVCVSFCVHMSTATTIHGSHWISALPSSRFTDAQHVGNVSLFSVTLVLQSEGSGAGPENGKLPKVVRRGCKRSFRLRERKAFCTGAGWGCTNANQVSDDSKDSWETCAPGPKDLLHPPLRLLQVAMGGNHLNQLPLAMQTEHAARCRERKGIPVGRIRHCAMRTLGGLAGRAATTAERMGREVETLQGAKKEMQHAT